MKGLARSKFERAAGDQKQVGLLPECWGVLKQRKDWWVLPIRIVPLMFGLLIVLAGPGAAPSIYTPSLAPTREET